MAVLEVIQIVLEIIKERQKLKEFLLKHLSIILAFFLVISVIINIHFLIKVPEIKPDNSEYSFENGTQGWQVQQYKDSRGIISLKQSKKISYLGKYSLELKTDLLGGDSSKHKGEAYTELSEPIDFHNKTITIHYYMPCPSQARGDPVHSNGLQIFVKDIKNRSQYCKWINIRKEDKGWNKIKFSPGFEEPDNGFMDHGFDPIKVIALGLKIAIGDSSKEKYKGSIFIDSIDW